MKDIGVEELKAIQLEVLQAVHDFCRENGIKYSLACGSAIGAVRHHGYIPWDDDIDIYLLRDDYNRLMELYPSNLRYQVISLERDNAWDRPYARAYDSYTVLKEKCNSSKIIGVGIDVYPIDSVPSEDETWNKFDKRRRRLQTILSLKQIKLSRDRSFSKNCLLTCSKVLLSPFPRKSIARFISKYIQKYNSIGGPWVFESAQGMIQKNRFRKFVFDRIIPVKFEDRAFMLFEDFDEYLSNGYGDYMKLPPKEKQIAHHVFTAHWKEKDE